MTNPPAVWRMAAAYVTAPCPRCDHRTPWRGEDHLECWWCDHPLHVPAPQEPAP